MRRPAAKQALLFDELEIITAVVHKVTFRPQETRFRYFWSKYVEEVDLRQHCLNCLVGRDGKNLNSKTFAGRRRESVFRDIQLNEARSRLIYICGVAEPYIWRNNFHLAMRLKPGASIHKKSLGIEIEIDNAEELEICEDHVDPTYHRNIEIAYRSCRNLQFAWGAAMGKFGKPVPIGVELDRVPKKLTISDGVRTVQFTQCLLQHAVPSTDGSGMSSQSCAVADRRWKWKYGQVSGKYNVRRRGQILEETKRTPRELAELCFEAMGERKYDISKMPNDILPFIEWDMETPDAALDQLCQLVNSHVCLRADDTAAIYRDGEGNDLPNIPSSSFSDGLDFGEKPGMCGVASAPFQWQVDLTMTPVGLDKDDIIKPIDSLSYMPKGGWGPVEVTEMEDVEKKYRKIAKETVWRWYLIGRPEGMEIMPLTKEKLRSVDQFFPLLDHQLDYTRLSQEQKIARKNEGRIDAAAISRKPRQVFGVFYDEDGTGTDNVEEFTDDLSPLNNELKTANLSVYSKSFQVDNDRSPTTRSRSPRTPSWTTGRYPRSPKTASAWSA